MFRGVTQLALDAKGRLAIPGKHRDLARRVRRRRHERTLIVTADPSRCLLVYPRATWEPIQARLMALSSFNERDPRRCSACWSAMPMRSRWMAPGRVLVPPALRQYAGLDHHVVLVGQGNKFELWDDAKWQEQTRARDLVPGRRPAAGARRLQPLMTDGVHVPVLLDEVRRARWRSDRGGIVRRRDVRARRPRARDPCARSTHRGRLVALDRDPDAEAQRASAR